MNDAYELRSGETHIEVHKFFPGAVAGVAIVTLILQASFPVYLPKLDILDLPLLITIYFGLSRRNPSTGLLLGRAIGLAQDALSGPTVLSRFLRHRQNHHRLSRLLPSALV